jgi:SAM-dependent methyltransferase
MAHKEQQQFVKWVKKQHPRYFKGTKVIDVGSKDINGNNRGFFRRVNYQGIDLSEGPNVDWIGYAHNILPIIATGDAIDVIISTEAAEHDKFWELTFQSMYDHLRPGGLLLITAGGEGREEHGTKTKDPWCSPDTNDYYRNITNEMFGGILKPEQFSTYYVNQHKSWNDFQFFGIKSKIKEIRKGKISETHYWDADRKAIVEYNTQSMRDFVKKEFEKGKIELPENFETLNYSELIQTYLNHYRNQHK